MNRLTHPDRHANQAGMSLVEVMVALAVVALTFAAAVGGLRVLARSGDRGTALIERHDMLSRGLDALRHDFERMERVTSKRGRATEFLFSGDEKGVTFVAVEPPIPSEAGPYFIVYSIERSQEGNALLRGRAPFDASAKSLQRLKTQDEVAVLDGAYDFRFSYLERKGGRERWVGKWADRDRLPELIRLEIAGLSAGSRPLQPLILRPRTNAEPACIKDAGRPCTMRTQGVLTPDPTNAPERKN